MSGRGFKSGFAGAIDSYIDSKVASGYKERSFLCTMRKFDAFCESRGIEDVSLTRGDVEEWTRRLPNEATTTHYARVNASKNLVAYLIARGHDICPIRDVAFRETGFQPHIYTRDEVDRYFTAVDAWSSPRSRVDEVQFPVLFRLMYCCGARVNEALGLRKCDVDLAAGVVALNETKNDRARLVALGPDMAALFARFADKTFYLLGDEDYVFRNGRGRRRDAKRLDEVHLELLRRAGIPFVGGGEGPRLHDWRHTHAVCAFKQMLDSGMDMYAALPVLSKYLGHKTIYATERYVRLTAAMYPEVAAKLSAVLCPVFEGGPFGEASD
ncbi:MAG: tyrosine-type recombinase/integrase [Eggerthellaceae bacterium]|nr:tyrosine-type recombinase/integrase [Eggerthellaceae bacterium]